MPGGGEVCMVFYSTNKSKILVAQLEGNGKMLITACINLADSLSMRYTICVDTSVCTSAGGVAGLLHGVLLYRPNDIGHTNGKCRVLGSSICTQDTTAQVIMFITPLDLSSNCYLLLIKY